MTFIKKIFLLLCILWCAVGLQAGKMEINRLFSNYYIFTTYKVYNGNETPANGMYIVTPGGVVLLDTPWDASMTKPLLDTIARWHQQPVVACIVTHYHDDRTAGLDILKKEGIKTWSSKKTYDLGKNKGEKTAEFQFNSDTTFNFGGVLFETYFPGEGHSKDNIVVWINKTKVLYGGCFIKSLEAKDLGNTEDANVTEWPISVRNTMKKFKSPKYVIPGHYSWVNKNAMMHTLYLLEKK